MSEKELHMTTVAIAAMAAVAANSGAAENAAVDQLIVKIRDRNDKVRAEAISDAGKVGAPAVEPLAAVMGEADFEVVRAAKRALWQIVRYIGRPESGDKEKVVEKLIALLADKQSVAVRREAVWMLSEIGGDEAVGPAAALLSNNELREDARMVLERLPGEKSLAALKAGLAAAPEDFKPNIAVSLRARGVNVPGIPNQRLVPTRQTSVKPVE